MKKSTIKWIILLGLVVVFIAGCTSQSDYSTPTSAFVGGGCG